LLMVYRTVFDISDRFPDAVIGLAALVLTVPILVLALRSDWRATLRRISWLWLGTAGFLWAVLNIHVAGGVEGPLIGGVGAAIALYLAFLTWRDVELPIRDGRHVQARTVAPIAAVVALVLTGLLGCRFLSAFDLSHQMSGGDVTVVTGVVQDAGSSKVGAECFTVEAHRYCYDGFSSIGFHQTAANGGPIRDGLQVRLSSIGDVIVRLEIADGQ
jgi:hypothetical protein